MHRRIKLASWSVPFLAGVAFMSLVQVFFYDDAAARHAPAAESLRHDAWERVVSSPVHSAPATTVSQSKISDLDAIHIAHAFCSSRGSLDVAENGLTVVRSILAARENGVGRLRKYVFHIVGDDVVLNAMLRGVNASYPLGTDHDAGTFMEKWGDVIAYANDSDGAVEIRTYNWEDLDRAIVTQLGAGVDTLDNKGFKFCSSVRLKVPFAVGLDAQRVIYIDNDSICLCDLTLLFDSVASWDSEQLIGAVPEAPHPKYPTHYTGMVPEHKRPTGRDYPRGLNAGVLLLHVGRLRQPDRLKAYWDAVVSIVKEGGYASLRLGNWSNGLIYYDQDILNILSVDHPEWFMKVEEKYNWRAWSWEAVKFSSELSYPYRPPVPCIEHYSAAGMWSGVVSERSLWGSYRAGTVKIDRFSQDGAEKRAKLWKYFHDSLDLRPARKHWHRREDGKWFPPSP